ncbi:MAG: SRPBCC family protein [Propylenella sp.]
MDGPRISLSRIIRAPRQFVFDAWTTPALLMKWWGPEGVECTAAEVDLREGGEYRIANRHSDGNVTWISGVFERVSPPEKLVYSWNIGMPGADGSRVTVEFRAHAEGTELILIHERLAAEAREMHLAGWTGCLDGLAAMVATS